MVEALASSTAYNLNKVEWQFFTTLTFERVPPLRVRKACVLEFVRRVAKFYKLKNYQWDLKWVIRHETGEKFGRPHFHLLIELPEVPSNMTSAAYTLKHIWEVEVAKGKQCCGFADVRPWDRSRNGVEYLVKDTGWDGANAYELSKFCSRREWSPDHEVHLMSSPSVVWSLFKAKVNRIGGRNRGGHYGRLLRSLQKASSCHRGSKKSQWSPERFHHPADNVGRLYC